jgi:hypothetical protein
MFVGFAIYPARIFEPDQLICLSKNSPAMHRAHVSAMEFRQRMPAPGVNCAPFSSGFQTGYLS